MLTRKPNQPPLTKLLIKKGVLSASASGVDIVTIPIGVGVAFPSTSIIDITLFLTQNIRPGDSYSQCFFDAGTELIWDTGGPRYLKLTLFKASDSDAIRVISSNVAMIGLLNALPGVSWSALHSQLFGLQSFSDGLGGNAQATVEYFIEQHNL